MKTRRSLGISIIAGFYIFGAIVLLYTVLFVDIKHERIGIATRIGLPFISEISARIGLIVLAVIMSYGLLKLSRWGFWLFICYSIYFFVISLILFIKISDNLFLGNMVSALFFLIYVYFKRDCFLKPKT